MNNIKEIILQKNEVLLKEHGNSEISISSVISMLSNPFDKEGVAKKTSEKYFNIPESEYYGMSAEEIIKVWDDKAATSCAYGKKLDEYIQGTLVNEDLELWKLDNNYEWDDRLKGICDGFDDFYKKFSSDNDYEDIGGEIPLLYAVDDVLVNGRTDRLFYSPSKHKLLVVDWKNTADIKTVNRWSRLLGPLSSFDDCNGNTYTLQVQFYKTALINTYPELGLTEDDVDVLIVQMLYGSDKSYNTYKENIPYNKSNIDRMCSFGYKKKQLLNKAK